MFKNIFRTFVSRLIAAFMTLGVVMMASRALGPEKYGTIGLIMVAISMALLFSALIGGTSLVYFTSRTSPSALFAVSTAWGLLMSLAVAAVMGFMNLYPSEYFLFVFLISFFANTSQNIVFIILGRERIVQQNVLTLLQVFLHIMMVFFFFHILSRPTIGNYLTSVLISHFVAGCVALLLCRKDIFPISPAGISSVLHEIIQYGFWVQVSAFVQLFNYRLSYYLVDWFLGRQMLGIYTLAVQLAESFWILPRSAAIVQFAYISNMKKSDEGIALSFKLMQICMLTIALFSIPVFFIPEHWLTFIFGEGYAGIKSILMLLLPAIVIFSGAIIISHFFSGVGKVQFNALTGTVGLVFTVVACLIFIPRFELSGAALAANICYMSMFAVSFLLFLRFNKTTVKALNASGITLKKILQLIKKSNENQIEL